MFGGGCHIWIKKEGGSYTQEMMSFYETTNGLDVYNLGSF